MEEYYQGHIPWATVKDIKSSKLFDTLEHVTEQAIANSAANVVPAGTVVVATRMAVGKCFMAMTDMSINQDLKALIPKQHLLLSEYLMMWLQHKEGYIASLGTGTTVKGVRLEQIKSLPMSLPPLPEQRKVAAILASIDDAIEKTETIIKQTEAVKSGLMQQLLTRGIGHTKFKKTEIGEIPEEWEVVTLGEITADSAFGPRFPAGQYDDNGNYALLRTTDITDDWEINYSTMPLADLPKDKFENHRLREGDLLVTRSGTCGVVCIFSEYEYPVIPGAFLIRFRLSDKAVPSFVRYAMMTSNGQERILAMAAGGVQKNLSGTNLKTLPLPLPPIQEQEKIVAILDSLQRKVALERKRSSQLATVKRGLMNDLLTGKIRVKVDEQVEAVVS